MVTILCRGKLESFPLGEVGAVVKSTIKTCKNRTVQASIRLPYLSFTTHIHGKSDHYSNCEVFWLFLMAMGPHDKPARYAPNNDFFIEEVIKFH